MATTDEILSWFFVKEYTKKDALELDDISKYIFLLSCVKTKEKLLQKIKTPSNSLFLQSNTGEYLSKFPIYHEHICSRERNVYLYYKSKEKEVAALIIVSYLMAPYASLLPPEQAIEALSKFFSQKIEFSEEFQEQIDIYFKMGAKIDTKHSSWITYSKKYNISYEEIIKSIMAQNSKRFSKVITPAVLTRSISLRNGDLPQLSAKKRMEKILLQWNSLFFFSFSHFFKNFISII